MKKVFTLLSLGIALFTGSAAMAQSFTTPHDTVFASGTSGNITAHNNITNTTTSNIDIQWKMVGTNFPADWLVLKALGICDRNLCYGPADFTASQILESPYLAGVAGDFHAVFDFDSVTTTGSYYLTVRLNNKAVPSDVKMTTFLFTKPSTSAVATPKVSGEVALYPNPATNSVNVVYDAAADVKNIAIYNIIGKQMNLYRATDNNSASLNIENMPSGIYFIRLINSHGGIVTTRKFTKQ